MPKCIKWPSPQHLQVMLLLAVAIHVPAAVSMAPCTFDTWDSCAPLNSDCRCDTTQLALAMSCQGCCRDSLLAGRCAYSTFQQAIPSGSAQQARLGIRDYHTWLQVVTNGIQIQAGEVPLKLTTAHGMESAARMGMWQRCKPFAHVLAAPKQFGAESCRRTSSLAQSLRNCGL